MKTHPGGTELIDEDRQVKLIGAFCKYVNLFPLEDDHDGGQDIIEYNVNLLIDTHKLVFLSCFILYK
jgi:hypothetical protein